jgi:hypothetical protein
MTDGFFIRFGKLIVPDADNLRIKLIEEVYARIIIIYLDKIKTIKFLSE